MGAKQLGAGAQLVRRPPSSRHQRLLAPSQRSPNLHGICRPHGRTLERGDGRTRCFSYRPCRLGPRHRFLRHGSVSGHRLLGPHRTNLGPRFREGGEQSDGARRRGLVRGIPPQLLAAVHGERRQVGEDLGHPHEQTRGESLRAAHGRSLLCCLVSRRQRDCHRLC